MVSEPAETTGEPADDDPADDNPADENGAFPQGESYAVREIDRRPHDSGAFTQGLEFDGEDLFESRGLFASEEQVTLTQIDPEDGSTIREVQRDPVIGDYFAEGLTVVGARIVQLTWQSNTAIVYDRENLTKTGELVYEGEGWGLCDEPDRFLMTNGTSTLTHRDLETFEVLDTVTVTLDGQEVTQLNEVECVNGLVWANVWNTNQIVVIDPDSGEVVSQIDVSALADPRGRFLEEPVEGAVLNGIAYQQDSDTWLLTGKQWPFMFEVAFECTAGCESQVSATHFSRSAAPLITQRAE